MKSAALNPTFKSTSPAPRKKVSGCSSAILQQQQQEVWGSARRQRRTLTAAGSSLADWLAGWQRQQGKSAMSSSLQSKLPGLLAGVACLWDKMIGMRVLIAMGDTPLWAKPVSSSAAAAAAAAVGRDRGGTQQQLSDERQGAGGMR